PPHRRPPRSPSFPYTTLFRSEITDAGRAHADDGLDEFRCGKAEEWPVRFARDRARQQRFAGARRAHQQDPVRDLRTKLLVLLWCLEEVDDLGQVLLGFLDAGDVGKGDPCPRVRRVERRLTLAEGSEKPA